MFTDFSKLNNNKIDKNPFSGSRIVIDRQTDMVMLTDAFFYNFNFELPKNQY
jgi:hypothetical protein